MTEVVLNRAEVCSEVRRVAWKATLRYHHKTMSHTIYFDDEQDRSYAFADGDSLYLSSGELLIRKNADHTLTGPPGDKRGFPIFQEALGTNDELAADFQGNPLRFPLG